MSPCDTKRESARPPRVDAEKSWSWTALRDSRKYESDFVLVQPLPTSLSHLSTQAWGDHGKPHTSATGDLWICAISNIILCKTHPDQDVLRELLNREPLEEHAKHGGLQLCQSIELAIPVKPTVRFKDVRRQRTSIRFCHIQNSVV